MVVFPNCKINLGLSVKRRRPDGYHDIETVFYPVGWKDVLEMVRAPDDELKMFSTGIPIDTEDNICIKAYRLLQKQFALPPVHIHLHKVIPTGAGLGGGSADAAFTLLLLNNKFQLGVSEDRLLSMALELGSDCPFFIKNCPVLATGRGERMKEIEADLSKYHLLIIYPGVHVSTQEAFRGIVPGDDTQPLEEIINTPVRGWKELLRNDFEKTIFKKHPVIAELKDLLYGHGALYASMSGTGSAVYGIFSEKTAVPVPAAYLSEYLPGKL